MDNAILVKPHGSLSASRKAIVLIFSYEFMDGGGLFIIMWLKVVHNFDEAI